MSHQGKYIRLNNLEFIEEVSLGNLQPALCKTHKLNILVGPHYKNLREKVTYGGCEGPLSQETRVVG